jgi:hypothetical protein
MKRALFGTVALAAMLVGASASADPAVSGLNGKISLGFGAIGPNDVYGGAGSVDVPLGGSWGAQGDAYVGGIHGVGIYGGGVHLFWRDPSQALAGIYASDQHYNIFGGVDVVKVGGELEYYFNSAVTLRTIAGWEGGDVKDRLFDRADIVWYPADNWALSLGHRYSLGVNAGVLGVEYQIPGTSLSLTAQGRLGEFSTSGGFLAVTWYVGDGAKPLVDRARHDDPVEALSDDVNAAGATGGGCGNQVGLGVGDRKNNVLFTCR